MKNNNTGTIKSRLYISGMDPNGDILADKHGLGFEVTKFSWAPMLEDKMALEIVREQIKNKNNLWLHAPFAELFPCAIDPLVREIAKKRYLQTIDMAYSLGIKKLIIHDGFIPMVYFPQWFIEQSTSFWLEFLKLCPDDITIALENVMDTNPDMLTEVVDKINDKRLGICLDVGHANTYISKVAPIEWVRTMSPFLFHTHIHNNEGDNDIHSPLGRGTMDMEIVLDEILKTNASLTIETMEAEESLIWLKEKGYLD